MHLAEDIAAVVSREVYMHALALLQFNLERCSCLERENNVTKKIVIIMKFR